MSKFTFILFLFFVLTLKISAQTLAKACIDGIGPDWRQLGDADFADVNGRPDTWTWNDSTLYCTGKPVGVLRSAQQYENFELVLQWKHLKSAGNSGVFVWVSEEALDGLEPDKLPKQGIEVQILDHGYTTSYIEKNGKEPEWFTSHGDIFAVGESTLDPFPPTSPNGSRRFPRKNLSKGVGEWNHYYIRCINGEVRLWVNGEEVSGGTNAEPRSGYFCLEAEGSPIEFKNIRVRELP